MASAKSEDEAIQNQELEEAIQEIKHLPEEEFNKAFEKFLVSMEERFECYVFAC